MSLFSKQLRQNPELISTSLKTRIAYNGGGKPEYIGIANVATGEDQPSWQIRKLTYDLSDNLIAIDYANDSSNETNDFVHKWSDRGTLLYGVQP